MGFRENLKEQLQYADMQVKELAARSGVNKRTIDSYLDAHQCMPSAEAAVKIARELGVTVEYLVTGDDSPWRERTLAGLPTELHGLAQTMKALDQNDRTVVIGVANLLKEQRSVR